jgi:osomolarity two-component system sensor histidine kinase SLN1
MFPSEQPGLAFSHGDEPIHDHARRPSLEEVLSSGIERPQSSQRPTFVAIPRPRSFLEDDNFLPSTPAPSTNSGGDPSIDKRMQVLVVDDDPWTRTLMKRMLTRLGCKVFTAENGEVALEMILGSIELTPSSDDSHPSGPILDQPGAPQAEENKFNVIFLDNQMPVLSGLKVAARLREMGRHDFIVGVTGNALLTDQEEYLSAGADRYAVIRFHLWPAFTLPLQRLDEASTGA